MTSKILYFFVIASQTFIINSQSWCPMECSCSLQSSNFAVDCSGLGLDTFPEFEDTEHVQILDLSENDFTAIPSQLSTFSNLQYLDISGNQISKLRSTSLSGLTSLRWLNLAQNNITNWVDINPNTILVPATSLMELSLADNPITSFSSNDEKLILISSTLRLLDLSNCKIPKISGQEVIQGMKDLEHLYLRGNPIRGMSDIMSTSLKTLDLSNCKLSILQSTALSNLPSLAYINLSRNYRLALSTKTGDFVISDSLKRIDLSQCNMDFIDLDGFPNLLTAVLKGNMLRQLGKGTFSKNLLLENLDLSSNSITVVNLNSFKHLKHLRNLDLSYNMIPRIDREIFKENLLLTNVNLSRNYFNRLHRIVAESLTVFNISWSEIMTIDSDALRGMPELVDLDISNNLITEIPVNLASESLQTLDLSMCRLSTVKNTTFADLPELTKINLSGNRFTTTFRTDFFSKNKYLQEIWLGDNPWRCECQNKDFFRFYQYLTDSPKKILDAKQLRCTSPEATFGKSWERACDAVWFPESTSGATEKIWTIFMVSVIIFFGLFCLIMSLKQYVDGQRKTRRERERQEMLEETRELARQNRLRLQQEAQLNAPDPRESHPPCYEDAVLMPRLDAASFISLNELGRKKRRRKNGQKTEAREDEVELRVCRCRSEEVLSMRESVYLTPIDNITEPQSRKMFNRNRQPFEAEDPQRLLSPVADTPIELHYHTTDILNLAQNLPSTSRTAAGVAMAHKIGNSLEEIRDFDDKSNENSPYAKRRIKHMSSFKGSKHLKVNLDQDDEIMVIEDYYESDAHFDDYGSCEDGNEFSTFTDDELKHLNGNLGAQEENSNSSSDSSSIVVLVHSKPSSSTSI